MSVGSGVESRSSADSLESYAKVYNYWIYHFI